MRSAAGPVPQAVQLDHHVHVEPDRLADLRDDGSAAGKPLGGDGGAAGALRVAVERPHLHSGDAFGAEFLRQLGRSVEERLEVLVPVRLAEPPVVRLLPRRPAHVSRTGAGVVDPLLRADGATQQVDDRASGLVAQ